MKRAATLPPLSILCIEDWVGPSDTCENTTVRPVSHRVHSRARSLRQYAELRADRCIREAFKNLRSNTMP